MTKSANVKPAIHGNAFRQIREQSLHQSLTAFATRAGVDAGQLSRIENGKRNYASYGWLLKVAAGLGEPVDAIARYER